MRNLFADLPSGLPEELVEILVDSRHIRIERIVSHGHSSPENFWYDQTEDEWIVVLKGQARLLLEGDHEPVELQPGDFINIPAHKRHRVEWTTAEEQTVWLAVFYHAD